MVKVLNWSHSIVGRRDQALESVLRMSVEDIVYIKGRYWSLCSKLVICFVLDSIFFTWWVSEKKTRIFSHSIFDVSLRSFCPHFLSLYSVQKYSTPTLHSMNLNLAVTIREKIDPIDCPDNKPKPYFKKLIYFLLKENCFTKFCCFLSNLSMNQP